MHFAVSICLFLLKLEYFIQFFPLLYSDDIKFQGGRGETGLKRDSGDKRENKMMKVKIKMVKREVMGV